MDGKRNVVGTEHRMSGERSESDGFPRGLPSSPIRGGREGGREGGIENRREEKVALA